MTGITIIIGAVLSIGFAKLAAMIVNWLCAHRLAKKIVFADKSLNLALIATYPIVLGDGLLKSELGGTEGLLAIGPPYSVLIWMGALGFLFLIRSTIAYSRYSPPRCEVSVESRLIDLRSDPELRWRENLIQRKGKYHRLASLPGNEQFTIDVSTKSYCLPDIPAEWNGLSIVHLTDFHFLGGLSRRYFEIVCELASSLQPDIFVFTGDVLDKQELVNWIPETLGKLKAPLGQYFVLGNHDWYHDPAATRREFVRNGWIDLASRFVSVPHRHASGSPLVLCGDETPWMGTHPDMSDAPAGAFQILLSHTPDNIAWARDNRMHLMLAGHTHGGQIRLPVLGPIYSPSYYGCRFASGVFWLEPTLMYVSRGVSGKQPIRYNCPPEVTKLVLLRNS